MATVRKKVDNRIRVQIENGVALQHRTMFVVVGDRGRDQVIFLPGKVSAMGFFKDAFCPCNCHIKPIRPVSDPGCHSASHAV